MRISACFPAIHLLCCYVDTSPTEGGARDPRTPTPRRGGHRARRGCGAHVDDGRWRSSGRRPTRIDGEEDRAVAFSIGPSHVTIADDVTKQVSVYENGVLVRTMPTSMGRGGTETVGGQTIAFWTQSGAYTVMDKANPVLMDSSTYGLPVDAPSGYRISVPYATRISPDGIYLHEREATVWAQGNTNVSAGCLNLSAADAQWFYEFSQPGDVVEVRNTGGQPLAQWQNGDWSVPWRDWLQGSTLRN
jgi:lipoprotein-anchoring transpeptidase ErfK/SrfK